MVDKTKLSRRNFLKAGAGSLAGMALSAAAPALGRTSQEQIGPLARSTKGGPMRYRTLGRTGLEVAEVGFGSYAVRNPDVILHALERGINYIDTAHCYPAAGHRAIRKALRGKRDKMIVTSKWCPYHSNKPAKKRVYLQQLDESLKATGMDYFDVLLTHQVGVYSDGTGVERLKNPELYEAWETAKKSGKARFFGCSGHDGDLMEVMDYAVSRDVFDVILCRYNFLDYPDQQKLIARAKAAGVGFIAMKTLSGAKGADLRSFQSKESSFKQAALKWVLSNAEVSNLIISMSSFAQVDEYAAASGDEFTVADRHLLNEYAALFSNEVCRFCNKCQPACPNDVPVADILRYSMYYHDYKQEARGLRSYAKIAQAKNASGCGPCPAPCVAECPYDLPIKTLLTKAHGSLA